MKILFVPRKGREEPWLSDVIAALEGRAEIAAFDPEASAHEQLLGVSVVIDQGGHASRELIDEASAAGVKLWQVLGTGLDHIDIDYVLTAGLRLAHTPGTTSAVALAEHALLLMLSVAKNLHEAERNARGGIMHAPLNDELEGRTVGLIGIGASGRALAMRAAAMGMRVLAIDPVPPPPEFTCADYLGGAEAIAQLLRDSDYVSLHVPLSTSTHKLIGPVQFALMKPTAVLVNVARGALVDEPALIDALTGGRLRAAAIDVFGEEPPDSANALLRLENVIATPHVAGMTRGTSFRRARICAENAQRVQCGLDPLHEIRV